MTPVDDKTLLPSFVMKDLHLSLAMEIGIEIGTETAGTTEITEGAGTGGIDQMTVTEVTTEAVTKASNGVIKAMTLLFLVDLRVADRMKEAGARPLYSYASFIVSFGNPQSSCFRQFRQIFRIFCHLAR